jgi:hypothetical protein
MNILTSLTKNDLTSLDGLTTIDLYPEAFAWALSVLSGSSSGFNVCHM